jgi:hypothetical protein
MFQNTHLIHTIPQHSTWEMVWMRWVFWNILLEEWCEWDEYSETFYLRNGVNEMCILKHSTWGMVWMRCVFWNILLEEYSHHSSSRMFQNAHLIHTIPQVECFRIHISFTPFLKYSTWGMVWMRCVFWNILLEEWCEWDVYSGTFYLRNVVNEMCILKHSTWGMVWM